VVSDLNPIVNVGLTCPFSQEKIMEVQCELLISNFKDPKTIALVKDTIGHISDGSSPHCAGAMKLWLKKAFEVKKQKSVQLRCSKIGCSRNTNPVPYRVAGSDVMCQLCDHGYGGGNIQCTGCRSNRSVSNLRRLCGGCGGRFA